MGSALPLLFKIFISAAPYIIAGLLIAGALHQWGPHDLLKRHLGRQGIRPLFKAVGIGALLPICSCGTIPLGVGLYRSGAAVGTILSFMTSSPVLSPVVVLLSFKLLGAKMAFTLLGTALTGSFLIGWVGNLLLSNRASETKGPETYEPFEKERDSNPVRGWLRWSFGDLGSSVSVELVIGLGLVTLILSFLPLEFVAQWLGSKHFTSLLLIVLLSLPVYSCSVPSVTIVQGLLLLGVSPGAAVVYLMAGPATNLGELNVIRAQMGMRTAAYYVVSLIVVALSAGMLADHLIFSSYTYAASEINGALVVQQCCIPVLYGESSIYAVDFSSVSTLEWVSTGVLAVVVCIGIFQRCREFFVNPCQSCVWSDYGPTGRCARICHVRRKHDLFRRVASHK